ncbi:unnamed protein product [Agarophyton chilense]|eukprot:gb/GEZJ01004439.1/.p1 GENE.gb/GEZJ01004439.1/~~gb/GEZJ01004439.1/.p1  ORF type:complete len:188 (+),score=26.63 gb/GEZJ01004439.1/:282-845(+)
MGKDQMIHVVDCSSSREAWKKLRAIYAEPSVANRMRLYKKLLMLHLGDADDVRMHVHDMARTRSRLRSVGVKIDDTLYKLALLRSLTSRFDSLVVALETQIDALSIEDLHARIYREELRQKKMVENEAKALRVQFDGPTKRQNEKSKIACFYCKKKGHKISECRKRMKDESSSSKDSAGQPHALTFG